MGACKQIKRKKDEKGREMVFPRIGAFFPVSKTIDEKILVGPVDEDTVHKPEKMAYIGVLCILGIVLDGLTFLILCTGTPCAF